MATLRQLRILPPTLRSSSPNLTRLLRAPRKRPTGGTAEQRDKLAPLQLPKLHPLPLAREQNSGSATISQGSLQCGIAVRPMSPRGQNPNASRTPVCQLSPAADKLPHMLWPASCHSTKSLRDSQRPRRLTATLSPGARSWVAGEAPCLEDRGVSNLSLKTGVAYDNQGYHPAASAYDRRYECAQALCWHAEGPHPQLQAVRGVSEAITRHGYMRGYPRLPAASGRHGDEHL